MKRVTITMIAALALWVCMGMVFVGLAPSEALAVDEIGVYEPFGSHDANNGEHNTAGDEGDVEPPGPLSLIDTGDDDDFGGEVNDAGNSGKSLIDDYLFEIVLNWWELDFPYWL
ncbi:MAG: hypothetical protein GY835_00280 [bacterium]|nr:hypothetical protein [bacterium]